MSFQVCRILSGGRKEQQYLSTLRRMSVNHVTTVKLLYKHIPECTSKKKKSSTKCRHAIRMWNSSISKLVKFLVLLFIAYLLDKTVIASTGEYIGKIQSSCQDTFDLFRCFYSQLNVSNFLFSHVFYITHVSFYLYCRLHFMQKLWT